jgi:hypothetical protein
MATKEKRAGITGKKLGGSLRDTQLCAARVGDEGMERSVARDFRQKVKRRRDGESDVDEIGVAQGGSELSGEGFVYGAPRARCFRNVGAVPAGEVHSLGVLAESESEGTADEAGAEDSDARDEMGSHWESKIES